MNPSTELVVKALDGVFMRVAVTNENIANASTPGFRPSRVRFEGALAAAAAEGPEAVRNVRPQITPDETTSLEGVRLDKEMAESTGAAGRYAALIEVLNRQLQIASLVAGRAR